MPDIKISADDASVSPNRNRITITATGVPYAEMLEHITLEDAVDYYGIDKVLDHIGKKEAVDHFEIQEA